MPNELAIKLSFINDMLQLIFDEHNLPIDVNRHIVAASNSLYEAEQALTEMVN